MLNVQDLLHNDTVKSILKKTGIPESQVQNVIKQASATIGNKFKENPKQMSSLLSSSPNTDADNKFLNLLENDFVNGLIKKVGLSESTAKSLKSAFPPIINFVAKKAKENGLDSLDGLNKMLSSFMGGGKNKTNNVLSSVTNLVGSFFNKKK